MNMQVQVLLIRLHQCNCHRRKIHTYECIVMKSQKSKVVNIFISLYINV